MKPDRPTKDQFKSDWRERLEELLGGRGTQAAVAKSSGLSEGAITQYKKGVLPGAYELARLAEALQVSADSLLGLAPEPDGLRDAPPATDAERLRANLAEQRLAEVADLLRTVLNQIERGGPRYRTTKKRPVSSESPSAAEGLLKHVGESLDKNPKS